MSVMDFFRKRNKGVIDLSNSQRTEAIRQKIRAKDNANKNKVVDLSGSQESSLGFLGALAGASANSSSNSKNLSGALETGEAGEVLSVAAEGRTRLKGILRDMKSKLDSTHNKIYKISDRLDLLEKKLERVERRMGFSDSQND